jgi:Na+/H+-translocating membrane pyrophosphatase
MTVDKADKIESTLKWQLFISSGLLTPTIVLLSLYILPDNFTFVIGETGQTIVHSTNWGVMVCVLLGLWSGLLIGYVTDYYTSNAYGYYNLIISLDLLLN